MSLAYIVALLVLFSLSKRPKVLKGTHGFLDILKGQSQIALILWTLEKLNYGIPQFLAFSKPNYYKINFELPFKTHSH